MANSDTEDDRMVPPPAVAVSAARQREAEDGRRFSREDANVGSSIIGGAVAIILVVLSVIALWSTS
jgi:hypothetical protein